MTRRTAAKQLAGALLTAVVVRVSAPPGPGGAGAAPTEAPSESTIGPAAKATPVVSFFLDQPYLDTSGLGVPYRPPTGMRSGQPVAGLSELEFRNPIPHA